MPILVLAALFLAACSPPPTAPTPTPPPAPIVAPAPPVAVPAPPVAPPAPEFPPRDPDFNLSFYRAFVHNGGQVPLRRQEQAPRVYLRTVDDAGAPIDVFTLDQTAAALESVAGQLTGVFGLAGLERGTSSRIGAAGWITVLWSSRPNEVDAANSVCGQAQVGGDHVLLFPKSRYCRCPGGPAVNLTTVKHELGHALGFWHSPTRTDLMFASYSSCDTDPSAQERRHAAVAYTRPNGSASP